MSCLFGSAKCVASCLPRTLSAELHAVNTAILDFFGATAYAAHMTFDDLIQRLRPATLAEIAELCGLSLRALSDLRAGKVETPRRATVIALAVALQCKPSKVRRAIQASYDAAQD